MQQVFVLIALCLILNSFFAESCDVSRTTWPTRIDDNLDAAERMQNLVLYHENACNKYSMHFLLRGNHNGGFGSAIMTAYKNRFIMPRSFSQREYMSELIKMRSYVVEEQLILITLGNQ